MRNGTRIRVIEVNGRTGTIVGRSRFLRDSYLIKLDNSMQVISFRSSDIEMM